MRSVIAPSRNVALEGLYVSSGVFCTQCEPEGFRRITCFPDRPDVLARYDVTLRADRARYPAAAVERQPRRRRDRSTAVDTSRDGGTRSRSRPTCSRWSQATSPSLDDAFVTAWGRRVALQIYATPRQHQPVPARDGVAEARDALGRGALRPRIRPRHVHDLLRRRFQSRRDGEQGPQHLQQPAAARRSRDGDGRRFQRRSRR